jgi:hypothetical protein
MLFLSDRNMNRIFFVILKYSGITHLIKNHFGEIHKGDKRLLQWSVCKKIFIQKIRM